MTSCEQNNVASYILFILTRTSCVTKSYLLSSLKSMIHADDALDIKDMIACATRFATPTHRGIDIGLKKFAVLTLISHLIFLNLFSVMVLNFTILNNRLGRM